MEYLRVEQLKIRNAKGDIVIKIGEIEVPDMMGYMTGLSKHEKGDSTIVIVKRGNKKIEFPIVFQ